ncbi:MAG TPA: zinc ABC transporter ATP-binding protein, partial [Porphyromonadaceae bacterium]|nr:zinc ABC transporter ATP-binding protein [Porphyromonadaceae bacterium]
MNTIIEFSHVVAGYDSKSILKELNLEIKEGDFWGIIGPNGGGKSTFIKTLIGLLKPLSGSIRYFRKGSSVSSLEVGYLPQYSMFDKKFPISVEEVVRSGLDRNCSSLLLRLNREQRQKVDSVLELVGMFNQRKEPIGELSGGQLQRTFLGRAIVSSPELLVLDEPQSYMDKNF